MIIDHTSLPSSFGFFWNLTYLSVISSKQKMVKNGNACFAERSKDRCFTRSLVHLFSVFQCKKVGVDRRKRQMGTLEDAVIALTSSQFDV
jgi:hypothetical protein